MENTNITGPGLCTAPSTRTVSESQPATLQPHSEISQDNLHPTEVHSGDETSTQLTTGNNNDTNSFIAFRTSCRERDVDPRVDDDITSVEKNNTDDITNVHHETSDVTNDKSHLLERDTCAPPVSRCTPDNQPGLLKTSEFQELYKRESLNQKVAIKTRIKRYVKRKCSRDALKVYCMNTFPVWSRLKRYNVRRSLASDIVAGLSVGVVQIPSSMAFAMLATLPPICGLYTAFISALVYFLFGTSAVISVGTSATISLVVGTAVENHEESFRLSIFGTNSSSANATASPSTMLEDSAPRIAAATSLTFFVGVVLVVLGKLRFGIVTSYMPDPMLGGFLTSAMILVMISQVKVVLGLRVNKHQQPFKCVKDLVEIGKYIHLTNVASLVTAAVCLLVLYVVKVCINQRFQSRLPLPVPIELIVVALGTVAAHFGDFHVRFGVAIVGHIPSGLPLPTFPPLQLAPASLLWDAITVAVIAYVISVSIAKTMVKKTKESIDPNQEMVAVGASSLGASLLSGFAVGVSLARTVVQKSAGAKTQVASVVGSFVVLLVVLSVGHLFYSLPLCVLAAVILIAFRGVVTQLLRARDHWAMCKYDFSMWVCTLAGVLCFGVGVGLVLGALVSLLTVIVRTQRLQVLSLGRVASSNMFVRKDAYTCSDVDKSIRIIDFKGPLYFANAELFVSRFRRHSSFRPEESVEGTTQFNNLHMQPDNCQQQSRTEHTVTVSPPTETMSTVKEDGDLNQFLLENPQFVILDCSGMTFSDKSGVTALSQLTEEWSEKGVTIHLAGLNDQIVATMERAGVWGELKSVSFVTVEGALQDAEWTIRRSTA